MEVSWIEGRTRNKIIQVKVSTWEDKKELMRKKNKLKMKQLFVENDLTKKEREIRTQIRKEAKKERIAKSKVKIGYKKLQINGKNYS